jgi:adenine-specific DNA methylase
MAGCRNTIRKVTIKSLSARATAVNDVYARRNTVNPFLKQSIEEIVFNDLETRSVMMDE